VVDDPTTALTSTSDRSKLSRAGGGESRPAEAARTCGSCLPRSLRVPARQMLMFLRLAGP
jgi:hypothetical protein